MNTFEDQTLPAYDRIHKVSRVPRSRLVLNPNQHAGSLIGTWKSALEEEVISRESSLSPQKGMKRKAVRLVTLIPIQSLNHFRQSDSIEDCEVRARYKDGELHRVRHVRFMVLDLSDEHLLRHS